MKLRTNFKIKFIDPETGFELPFSSIINKHIIRTSTINAWSCYKRTSRLELYISEDIDNKVASAIDDLLDYQKLFTVEIQVKNYESNSTNGVVIFDCKPVEVIFNAFDNYFQSSLEPISTNVDPYIVTDFGSKYVTNRISLEFSSIKRK